MVFRFARLLVLLCLLAGGIVAHGQNSSISIDISNLIIQGELNQVRSSIPFQVVAAPAYVYTITGNVHGSGPVYSTLIPNSEPLGTALETISKGLSSGLSGSVSNPGSKLPSNILSLVLSSGTNGAFNATFSISLDSTGLATFAITNVSMVTFGQPDTVDTLVFDSGTVTVTALFADVSVATLSATNVSTVSATLQSSIFCPNKFQAYFVYGTDASFSSTSSAVSLSASSTAQTVAIPVTGLLPHQTYYFKAVGEDITGPSYGSTQAFRTADIPPVAGSISAFCGLTPLTIPVLAYSRGSIGSVLKVTGVTDGIAGKASVTKGGTAVTYRFTTSKQPTDHFTYSISDGFGGTATGHVSLVNYAALAGVYAAVLVDSRNAGSGYLRVTLNANGGCTGALTIAGMIYQFHGALDSNGQFTTTLNTSTPYGSTVTLSFTPSGEGYALNAGALMNGVYLGGAMAPASVGASGSYTLLIPPPAGASFAGAGYAIVQVGPTGQAAVSGALPDGAPFSCAAVADTTGHIGIYSLLYAASNPGSLAGALAISGSSNSLVSGTLVWTKPALSNAGINQGPFSITLTGSGGRYVSPVKTAALQFGTPTKTGNVILSSGNLNSPVRHGIFIAPTNRIIILNPGPDALSLAIQPATGLLTGKFIDPLNGAARTIHGIVIQGAETGGGYFLGDSAGGAFGMGP